MRNVYYTIMLTIGDQSIRSHWKPSLELTLNAFTATYLYQRFCEAKI